MMTTVHGTWLDHRSSLLLAAAVSDAQRAVSFPYKVRQATTQKLIKG